MRFDGMHNLPTPQCLANVGDEPGQVGFVICTTDDLKLRVEDCRVALRKELDHGFALGEHFRVTKDGRLQLSLTTRELQQSAVPVPWLANLEHPEVAAADRKSVVSGKRGAGRVEHGGGRTNNKKKK